VTQRQFVRVRVLYGDRRQWSVRVCGFSDPGDHAHVVVAWHSTRDAANDYAKKLRKALRGE